MRLNRISKLQSRESGFSLIEVIVSLFIMTIAVVSIAPSFAFQMKMNTKASTRTAAIEAGQAIMDELRFVDPSTMPMSGSGAVSNITIDNKAFQVTPYYCVTSAYCSTFSRHVVVKVAYQNKVIYATETVYTYFQ